MADRGAWAAMADRAAWAAMVEQGARAAMADLGTWEAMAGQETRSLRQEPYYPPKNFLGENRGLIGQHVQEVRGSLLFVTYTIIQGIISSEMKVRTGPLNGQCKKIK